MGNQRKHRQAAEAKKKGGAQQVDRVAKLLDEIRPVVTSTVVQDHPASAVTVQPPVAPTSPVTTAPVTAPQFPRGERKPGDTIAGQSRYDRYFAVVAQAVREGKLDGFRSLGFIPGPALILEETETGIRVVAATPEEIMRLRTIPITLKWENLPQEIRVPLEAHRTAVAELGHNPSSYSRLLARELLEDGHRPACLCMLMSNFRYRAGDPERPLGIVLVPETEGNGLKIDKAYNPNGIPDVPAAGATVTLDWLNNGFGPVQKLLRTWASMEVNYKWRYHRDGSPKDHPPMYPTQMQGKPGDI